MQYPFKAKNLLLSAFMERGMDEQEEILNKRCHSIIVALVVLILVHFQLQNTPSQMVEMGGPIDVE